MGKLGDFIKRIKVEPKEKTTTITENINTQEVEIHIENDVNLFKDEKEKIIQGAKELLDIGKAESLEEAIITFAVMFRGLKFCETKTTQDGKKVVVLRETAKIETRTDGDERGE